MPWSLNLFSHRDPIPAAKRLLLSWARFSVRALGLSMTRAPAPFPLSSRIQLGASLGLIAARKCHEVLVWFQKLDLHSSTEKLIFLYFWSLIFFFQFIIKITNLYKTFRLNSIHPKTIFDNTSST